MKTRSLLALVVALLLLFVTGCSQQEPTSSQADTPTSEPDIQSSSDQAEILQSEPDIQPQSELPPEYENYQTYTFETWDQQTGYKFECTVRYTPWIITADTDTLASAWQLFGDGNSMPSPDYASWDLTPDSDMYRARYNDRGHTGKLIVGSKADMYYLVGDVTYRNITGDDWHLSESAKASPFITLSVDTGERLCTMGKSIYDIYGMTIDGKCEVCTRMSSDDSGPYPFVLAFFNTKTPDTPDGLYTQYLSNPLQMEYVTKEGGNYCSPTINLPAVE